MRAPNIVLPRSGKRSCDAFVKLLRSVSKAPVHSYDWDGRIFRAGRSVPETELHPEGYPSTPILLEYATSTRSQGKPGGHVALYVLWRWDAGVHRWEEIGRAECQSWEWVFTLAPLAIVALGAAGAVEVQPDLNGVRRRIASFLDREIAPLQHEHRAQVLSIIHDQLAIRFAAAQPRW